MAYTHSTPVPQIDVTNKRLIRQWLESMNIKLNEPVIIQFNTKEEPCSTD